MAVSLSTLRSLHPDWNIVDFMEAPNGGIWAVGADGGVFTLNAEGNQGEGEAPFLGSYHSDFLAPHRNDPNRTFEGIEASGTGYRIVTTGGGGTGYDFAGQPSTAVTTPKDLGPQQGATPTATNPDDASGKDLFTASLISSGFSPAAAASLTNQLWATSKTKTGEELWVDLRKTPEYTARFGGLEKLRERGRNGEYIPYIPTEAEYVTSEAGYAKVARDAGLPAGFYDEPSDFAGLIGGGVSVSEYSRRVGMGTQAALGTDPTLREEIARQYPGITMGDLTAFFLDPDKGQGVIEAKWTNAQIGTAARRSGFGVLTQAEIEGLAGRGLTEQNAGAAFTDVARAGALETETVGETMAGEDLTRTQQLGLGTGDEASVAAFERRRKSRKAAFEGGGGAAQGGAGTSGLGTAR